MALEEEEVEEEEGHGLEEVVVGVIGPWITGTWVVTLEDSSLEVQVHQTGSENHQGGCLEVLGSGMIEDVEDLNDRTTEISPDNSTTEIGKEITLR